VWPVCGAIAFSDLPSAATKQAKTAADSCVPSSVMRLPVLIASPSLA
jgi:hypothetical protein